MLILATHGQEAIGKCVCCEFPPGEITELNYSGSWRHIEAATDLLFIHRDTNQIAGRPGSRSDTDAAAAAVATFSTGRTVPDCCEGKENVVGALSLELREEEGASRVYLSVP